MIFINYSIDFMRVFSDLLVLWESHTLLDSYRTIMWAHRHGSQKDFFNKEIFKYIFLKMPIKYYAKKIFFFKLRLCGKIQQRIRCECIRDRTSTIPENAFGVIDIKQTLILLNTHFQYLNPIT